MPEGIVTAQVCLDSGMAPSDLCSQDPRGSRVTTELFIKGTEPVQICDVHVAANIDTSTGLLATEFCPIDLVRNKIFITRTTTPRVTLRDAAYVLPTAYCTAHTHAITPTPTPEITPTPTPGEGGNPSPTPTTTSQPTPSVKPSKKP
jgi:penicillin-binding protein 1A